MIIILIVVAAAIPIFLVFRSSKKKRYHNEAKDIIDLNSYVSEAHTAFENYHRAVSNQKGERNFEINKEISSHLEAIPPKVNNVGNHIPKRVKLNTAVPGETNKQKAVSSPSLQKCALPTEADIQEWLLTDGSLLLCKKYAEEKDNSYIEFRAAEIPFPKEVWPLVAEALSKSEELPSEITETSINLILTTDKAYPTNS